MRRMEFSLGRKLTVLIVVLDITLSTTNAFVLWLESQLDEIT